MSATWAIDCDEKMLDMVAFAVEMMGQFLKEDLDKRKAKDKVAARLSADIKTANRILAAVFKAQVNLAVAKDAATKVKVRRPSKKAGPGNTANKKARR